MKIINLDGIDPKSILNIVFDWGGVITNIDYQAAVNAFNKIGHTSFDNFFSNKLQNDLFGRIEKGLVEPEEFYNEIRTTIGNSYTNDTIKKAWCEMLLDTPYERINLLMKLRSKYAVFLLSNTNKIHTDYYTNYLNQTYKIDFQGVFQKTYFSHELCMRKPDPEIFKFVLFDSNLNPKQTLFIDDTETNIDAAASLGIMALHLTEELTIENILRKWAE